MDINTPIGKKITTSVQSLKNGSEQEQSYAILYLKPKRQYTLKKIVKYDWHTDIWIAEVPGVKFNSVQFENL